MPSEARGRDADTELAALLHTDEEPDVDGFWEDVSTNLAAKRLRLLFVADFIPDPLARVVEFLNAQMSGIEVLAVEIKRFHGGLRDFEGGHRARWPKVRAAVVQPVSPAFNLPPPLTSGWSLPILSRSKCRLPTPAGGGGPYGHHPVAIAFFGERRCTAARRYHPLVELPTFGHSENHAGLQICDIVCSALLYPIACFAYCTGHMNNVRVQPHAADLRHRYGRQLKEFRYRYRNPAAGRYEGGFVVSDAIGRKSGSLMFR